MKPVRSRARSLGLFAISSQIVVMVAGLLAVCCSDGMPMHHDASAMDACTMQHHSGDHATRGGRPTSDRDGPTIGCSMSSVTFVPLLGSIGVLPEATAGPALTDAGDVAPAATHSALRLTAVPLPPPPRA